MLAELWEEDQVVLFVGAVVDEHSDTLGFYYLQPRNRFWELLELSGLTPKRIITKQESKALSDGHRDGSLSEPVRSVFIEKKISQLAKLGIGLTALNRRCTAKDEKDKEAKPTDDDIRRFVARVEKLKPRIVAFVMADEVFVESFGNFCQGLTDTPGPQTFRIGNSVVWFLGSTSGRPRGDALVRQEDAFFALGEAVQALRPRG